MITLNTVDLSLFPRPRRLEVGEEIPLPIPRNLDLVEAGEPEDRTLFEAWRRGRDYPTSGSTAGEPRLTVHLRRTAGREMLYDESTGALSSERYRLEIVRMSHGARVILAYTGLRGLRCALATLDQILRHEHIPEMRIHDGPRFAIRGIIEGYYGPPWPKEDRLSIMELMARHKMNAYFYAPKDDLYHRSKWRDLYNPPDLQGLEELCRRAAELDMDFWYNIAPGLSMIYSGEADYRALMGKLDQLLDIGVRNFGLLYDDIPETLQHPEDRKLFQDLPQAHAALANRLFRDLAAKDASIRLAVCPTQYSGQGNEYYISRLGLELDPGMELMWTGPQICSHRLDLRDASLLSRTIHRPVLYWDNYPVNDCEMIHELHIGPYRNRDIHLFRASAGLVANGMEYPESSKIPFLTIAGYLWNPEAYDPETAWDYALREVVGKEDWQDFKIFADNSRYSCLCPSDSPMLKETLQQAQFRLGQGDRAEALALIEEQIQRLQRAVKLFARGLENRRLQEEIARWVRKFSFGVDLLKQAAGYLKEPSDSQREGLSALFQAYRSDNTRMFGDTLASGVEEVLEQ